MAYREAMESQKKYWFRSKYGFGWYPVTMKGSAVFILYFVFLGIAFTRVNAGSHSASDTLIGFAPFLFGATVILLFICYLMGEPIKVKNLKI